MLAYFSRNDPWAPRSCFADLCKVSDQLDTRLNTYGLISSQSMLIYHLKLKSALSRKWLLGFHLSHTDKTGLSVGGRDQ